jgi:hypothetical protein
MEFAASAGATTVVNTQDLSEGVYSIRCAFIDFEPVYRVYEGRFVVERYNGLDNFHVNNGT